MTHDATPDVTPDVSVAVPLATDTLFASVYDELKRIAHVQLRAGPSTLRTTELVHEAFLRIGRTPHWQGRAHFFAAASRAMRQVLVDFARRRRAVKRGGGEWHAVSLTDSGVADRAADDRALNLELDELVALDDALVRLDARAPRLRQVVELRFFAGLEEEEIAAMLGVSTRTVERDWLKARLFLLRELESTRERGA